KILVFWYWPALTIRYLSQRCYVFLRETLHFPLPGLSTLRRWASTINIGNGVIHDVLSLMAIFGTSRSRFQKCTVLSFDEMKVESVYEYDRKNDEVMGPYSYMQVVMARGLFESWKQPIYIGFDTQMTKEIL